MTADFDATTYHYPPEILTLLIDAISKLCRSKRDVAQFFRGAGVPGYLWVPWQQKAMNDPDSIRKHEIARDILCKLNEREDNEALRLRREIVKRVVEFEDFSGCWEKDQLAARGLVASIRGIVNAKDTITRINQERERERAARQKDRSDQLAAAAARRQEREAIRRELFGLFSETDVSKRGIALEGVLNGLFKSYGILVREAFRRVVPGEGTVEQIDGVIHLDGHLYLVEMKWHSERLGRAEVAPHLASVYNRGDVRGIIISNSGFTGPAIYTVKEGLANKVLLLCELQEIVLLLERERDLAEFLRQKVQAAAIDKEPLFRPL